MIRANAQLIRTTERLKVALGVEQLPPVFPATHGARVVPLMVGVRQVLFDMLPEGAPKKPIRRLVGAYCGTDVYLKALAAEGSMRHNLAGEPIEPVSDEHRQKLRSKAEKAAAPAEPGPSEPEPAASAEAKPKPAKKTVAVERQKLQQKETPESRRQRVDAVLALPEI